MNQVILYSKPGCHLCDDAEALLGRLKRRHQFSLDKVDITSDPALFRQYDIRIPVIVVDGQHEIDAPIGEEELRRLLR